MAGEVTFDEVDGLSKKVYADVVVNALPEAAILQRMYPLASNKRLGDTYQQSVVLDPPNGITYEGSEGDIVNLATPEALTIKQAALPPFATSLRVQSSMAAFSRLQEQGEGVVKSYIAEQMLAMKASIANRVEASLLRGQSPTGYGVVESVTGVNADYADVVFTEASFAPGLFFAFAGKSKWSTWQAGGTARLNTDGSIKLLRVDSRARTVRFKITGTVAASFVATDILFPYSARTGAAAYNEAVGLFAQASNTTGTSLGIDAGTYPTWAGNTANVGGNLTYAGLESYCGDLRDRGAEGKIVALVPNRLWGELKAELMTQRILDSSYNPAKGRTGVKSLQFTTADLGDVDLVVHPFLPLGSALLLPEADVQRVGSSDVVFGIPGRAGDQMWQYVQDKNAAELRCYTDQAILLRAPSHAYALTGISYT